MQYISAKFGNNCFLKYEFKICDKIFDEKSHFFIIYDDEDRH